MSQASNYLEEAILSHIFRGATFSVPTKVAVALCTSGPTDTNTGATITEVTSGTGYARVAVNPSTANWSSPSGDGQTDNVGDLSWTASGGNWGTITHFAICDSTAVSSSTGAGGNLLVYGTFTDARIVNDGDTMTINAGDLDINCA